MSTGGDGAEDSRLQKGSKEVRRSYPFLGNRSIRAGHQKDVDLIDIPSPTAWLHHEATAALRFCREAQEVLQLQEQGPQQRIKKEFRTIAAVVTQAKSEGRIKGTCAWHGGVLRTSAGSEVLPWGSWPIPLKNHDGQSFYPSYRSQVGGLLDTYDCSTNGDEDLIHDRLLASSCLGNPAASTVTEATVSRLRPGEDGGWIEVGPPKTTPVPASVHSSSLQAASIQMPTDPQAQPLPDNVRCDVVNLPLDGKYLDRHGNMEPVRLEPGWFGGWVEVTDRGRKGGKKRKADEMTMDTSATSSCDSASNLLAAEPAGRVLPPTQRGILGDRAEREGKRKRVDTESLVGQHGTLGGKGLQKCGDIWQGWTVSEPAKEVVRRVWARARRRRRDAGEPQFIPGKAGSSTSAVAGSSTAPWDDDPETDSEDGPSSPTPAPACGVSPDPVLLACLGRECEGIIDAVLHVILGQRLGDDARVAGGEPSMSPRPRRPASDWADVLTNMRRCLAMAKAAGEEASSTGDGGDGGYCPVQRDVPAEPVEQVHGSSRSERVRHEAEARAEKYRRPTTRKHGGDSRTWGGGENSDGTVVVVSDALPALPLNKAVLTRSYNRLLRYLHKKDRVVEGYVRPASLDTL